MESLTIAIVSGDKNYAKALSMSLLSVCDKFIIRLFDGRQFVHQWSEHRGREPFCNTFDIILWAGSEISDAYGENIIYLAEKASMIRRDFSQRKFCLYKYSSAQSMLSSIFEIYSFLTGRKASFVYGKDVSLIAFASCRGGSGCSTMARAVAQEMSRFGEKKVLYVSMEEIESTRDFMKFPAGLKSVGEYLYRLFAECGGNMPFLESYVAKDYYGIESFGPTSGRNTLLDLNRRDIQKFLISLIDSGRYNLILVDLGTSINEAGLATLEIAGRICFVSKTSLEDEREEQYLSHLMASGDKDIIDKIIRVTNIHSKRAMEIESSEKNKSWRNSIVSRAMTIGPMIRNSDESLYEIMLEGDFGESIRQLATTLMDPVT